MFEGAEVPRLNVLRVLQGDDVFAAKLLIRHQVPPHPRLDVQFLDSIPRKNISRVTQGHNMRVVREDFEGHRVDIFVRVVLCEIKLDEIRALKWGAINRIRAMLFYPW